MIHSAHCRNRGPALLALLALVLQILAFSISGFHAAERLAQSQGGIFEVCTSAGMIRLTAEGDPAPQEPQLRQNCYYCAASSGLALLFSHAPAPFRFPLVPTLFQTPLGAEQLPPAGPDLRHAPSRGPPFLA